MCQQDITRPSCGDWNCKNITTKKGIEVGHTFLLGDKYSKSLEAKYKTEKGGNMLYQMGCFGIGVSRVLAASCEVLSTETELRWPERIAPFSVAILAPKGGSKEEAASNLLQQVIDKVGLIFKDDFIVDNRAKLTIGKKLRDAKKTGYPYIILFGKKCIDDDPKLELHNVNTGETMELKPSEIIQYLSTKFEVLSGH